jgi:hypothetical protein
VILIFPREWALRYLKTISGVCECPDVLENYDPPELDSTRESGQLFIDFFEDRKRSGRYHVTGDDYARTALQCIQYGFDIGFSG